MRPVQHRVWKGRQRHPYLHQDMGLRHVPESMCDSVAQVQWGYKKRIRYSWADFQCDRNLCVDCCSCCGNTSVAWHPFWFLGSECRDELLEYAVFDLCLLQRCLQKCARAVWGSSNAFSMTEISAIVLLKGAEREEWMCSRHALRHALVMWKEAFKVLLAGVCQTIVSFLMETGCKTDSDSSCGIVFFAESLFVFSWVTQQFFSVRRKESMVFCM